MAGKRRAKAEHADHPHHDERRTIRLPRQSQIFFLALLLLAIYLTWAIIKPFLIYIITGIFVAVLALPIDKFWERMLPNRVAAGFTMLSLFLILTFPLALLAVAGASDVQQVADGVQNGAVNDMAHKLLNTSIGQWAAGLMYPGQSGDQLNATVDEAVRGLEMWIQEELRAAGEQLLDAMLEIFIAIIVILFVVYYVLTEGEILVAYLKRVLPLPPWQVDHMLHDARVGLQGVFMGQIMTAVIQGTLGGIGWAISGLDGAVLAGAVMAVLSLLPILGTFLVWIPGGVYLLSEGHVLQGVFLLVWGTLIVIILVDNVIRPKLIGSKTDIHPVFVLLGILGGAAAFGFIGLFLGPLLVGVTISMLHVWEDNYMDPDIARAKSPLRRKPGTMGPL